MFRRVRGKVSRKLVIRGPNNIPMLEKKKRVVIASCRSSGLATSPTIDRRIGKKPPPPPVKPLTREAIRR
jgi:hypothetical protein